MHQASRIVNFSFTFEDKTNYESKVRKKTMKAAKAKAAQLAELEGLKLAIALSASKYPQDTPTPSVIPTLHVQRGRASKLNYSAAQQLIEPCWIDLSYTINITYELERLTRLDISKVRAKLKT